MAKADDNVYHSSVWINQELAILAYRRKFEGIDIPVLAFKDHDVRLDGAMTALILNPFPIGTEQYILDKTKNWLSSSDFVLNCDAALFPSKWATLSSESQKVISALLDEGGVCVKETAVRVRLQKNITCPKQLQAKQFLMLVFNL